jgi:hypothetical protein
MITPDTGHTGGFGVPIEWRMARILAETGLTVRDPSARTLAVPR